MKYTNAMTIENAFERMKTLIRYNVRIIQDSSRYYELLESQNNEPEMRSVEEKIESLRDEVTDIYYIVTGLHATYKQIITTLKI